MRPRSTRRRSGTINGKGVLNNRISEHVFTLLSQIGIPTHFIRRLNMREQLIRQVEIIPIEVVVRNVAAGSISQAPRHRRGRTAAAHADRILLQGRCARRSDGLRRAYRLLRLGSNEEMHDMADMAIRVNDFMSGMFAGDRHPADRLQARIRPHLGR